MVRVFLSKVLFFVVATLLLFTMSGCEKWSHNGDLDGQWQVLQVSFSGEDVKFPDGELYYYNFYLHTFQLTYTGHRPIVLTGNLTYDKHDDKIGLEMGFVKAGKVDGALLDRFIYWGMPLSGEAVMTIKELTSSRLIMEYEDVVITCRKF